MSCKSYHAERNWVGKIGVCWATKECEPCSCDGDEAKCDFYDYVRERAKNSINRGEIMSVLCVTRKSDDKMVLSINSSYITGHITNEKYFKIWCFGTNLVFQNDLFKFRYY